MPMACFDHDLGFKGVIGCLEGRSCVVIVETVVKGSRCNEDQERQKDHYAAPASANMHRTSLPRLMGQIIPEVCVLLGILAALQCVVVCALHHESQLCWTGHTLHLAHAGFAISGANDEASLLICLVMFMRCGWCVGIV